MELSARDLMSPGSQFRPVLILGAAPRISVPVARSLHRHGIPVDIASLQPEEPSLRSRAVRNFHRLPALQHDPAAFTDALLSLIRKEQFDWILPASDPALAALSDLYDELRPLLHVGCPPPHAVQRVLNKSLTMEAAQRCGIRVPLTCSISTAAELDSAMPSLRFPVVVKPEAKGAGPSGRVVYCNSAADLSSAIRRRDGESSLVQEYCPGVGVGIELLMHNGECIAQFQHRRLREAPATGGVAVAAISELPDPQLLQSSLALLRALEWEGVAMVEFRLDPVNGSAVLMEVNGRFWGSVSLPIMAGVDFPLYYWQLVHGEQPLVPQQYAVGMRWRWSPGCLERVQGILSRDAGGVGPRSSQLKQLLSAAADFSPFTKEALWSWSDPLPFFAELSRAIRAFITAGFKSLFRRLLPRRPMLPADPLSRLTPEARSAYERLRADASFPDRRTAQPAVGSASSFLFVCYGNLMRSPMAEAMLKHVLAERGINGIVVRSAGVHAVPGREAHPWALAVSRELSLPLDQHRAQPVTAELVASSDAIFAMDFENLAELETLYPAAREKMFLLGAYEGQTRDPEIPDPYFTGLDGTRRCYLVLRNCIHTLASDIAASRRQPSPRP